MDFLLSYFETRCKCSLWSLDFSKTVIWTSILWRIFFNYLTYFVFWPDSGFWIIAHHSYPASIIQQNSHPLKLISKLQSHPQLPTSTILVLNTFFKLLPTVAHHVCETCLCSLLPLHSNILNESTLCKLNRDEKGRMEWTKWKRTKKI